MIIAILVIVPAFFYDAPFGEGFTLFAIILLVISSYIGVILFMIFPKWFLNEGAFLFKLLVKKPLKTI